MAQRATSLGPKPSLVFCFCFLLFFCFVFFGGFKGQVRWPKGPPHLALNPPYFLFVFYWFLFFFIAFLFCFCTRQTNLFSPKKGHFLFIFQCLPLFLFSLFGASPISFPFSFFVSLLLFSFFLPSCFSFSLSDSCFFFLLCLLFLFQDVILFLLFCLLSCVLLNHNISFFLLCILFSGCCFFVLLALLFCFF